MENLLGLLAISLFAALPTWLVFGFVETERRPRFRFVARAMLSFAAGSLSVGFFLSGLIVGVGGGEVSDWGLRLPILRPFLVLAVVLFVVGWIALRRKLKRAESES